MQQPKTFLTPKELFEAAQLGTRLKPKQRVEVMVWLEVTGEVANYTEPDLAAILGCKRAGLIRLKLKAQQRVGEAISSESAMSYMAEYLRLQDLVIKECVEGAKKAPKNSTGHVGYLRLLKETSSDKIDKLQSIGVIPKELGRLTSVVEEWVATVSKEGVANVEPVGGSHV